MSGAAPAAAGALDAFVLRTLLVTALTHLPGGAHWWLPARLPPRLGVEPPEIRTVSEGRRARIPGARGDALVDVIAKERQPDVRDIPG